MFDYGPQDDDELNMVLNKRAPGQMKLSREWRIWLQPHQGEPDWLEAARAARLIMRAHAKDHETEICELVGGHIKLLTDDELAEYEAIPDRSDEEEEDDVADEDGGAGGSDGSGAKENARGNKAAKPAKPAAAKKSAAKAKKRAAAPESSDEEADDDFEEEALKPKRKYVKKAAKEAAKEVELFFCVIANLTDRDPSIAGHLMELSMNIGLDTAGEKGVTKRETFVNMASAMAGSAPSADARADMLLHAMRTKARSLGIKVNMPVEPEPKAADAEAPEAPEAEA